jgi:hypothetical protein
MGSPVAASVTLPQMEAASRGPAASRVNSSEGIAYRDGRRNRRKDSMA